jgi:hypothetical protein
MRFFATTACWLELADREMEGYLDFIAKTTTTSKTISKNVFTTSRMGTIASSLLLGAATAGGANLGASTLGGSNLGGGGAAGAFMAGGAIAGAGGGANGTAAAGAGATGTGAAPSTEAFTALPEIMRVNSPGPEPELALVGAAITGAEAWGKNGSGGASRGT